MALGLGHDLPLYARARLIWQRRDRFWGDFGPFWSKVSNCAVGRGLRRRTSMVSEAPPCCDYGKFQKGCRVVDALRPAQSLEVLVIRTT